MLEPRKPSLRPRVGLALGPLLFAGMLLAPAPGGLDAQAWAVAAVLALMATWWATEALPLAVTAFLPVLLFPVLGVRTLAQTTAPYADPLVFLFLGGFVLAAAVEKHGLHRRVALRVLARTGTKPRAVVGGVLLVSALVSMWVSNTATSVMMLPLGVSIAALVGRDATREAHARFSSALLLAIAFGCSIGGLGTLVGTPPNALLAAYLRESHGVTIGFAQWMLVGVPLVALVLPLAWLILTRLAPGVPRDGAGDAREALASELADLRPPSRPERRVALVFLATALLWAGGPLLARVAPALRLTDAGIAMGALVALFLLPSGGPRGERLVEWPDAARIPWNVLLLFGGGLSLAAAMTDTGLARAIGGGLAEMGAAVPLLAMLAATAAVIILLSEFASNTATAAAFLPVGAALAEGLGLAPAALAVPIAVAASGGFMLPVATPPNAVVYGSGLVPLPHMVRAGALLDVAFVALALVAAYALVPLVLG